MGRFGRSLVLLSGLLTPGIAAACIWGWSPTSYVYPTAGPAGSAGCPVPTTVRRCYYEPRTTYQTVTQRIPQLTWTQRCYYDPIFGTYQTLWVPTIAVVEQQVTVPVTTYEQRCETVTPEAQPQLTRPSPGVERLPEPSTEQRYYYAPNESQKQDSSEGVKESQPQATEPGPVPPPPPVEPESKGPQSETDKPDKSQGPDARRGGDRVTVVRVVWRPVTRPTQKAQTDARLAAQR